MHTGLRRSRSGSQHGKGPSAAKQRHGAQAVTQPQQPRVHSGGARTHAVQGAASPIHHGQRHLHQLLAEAAAGRKHGPQHLLRGETWKGGRGECCRQQPLLAQRSHGHLLFPLRPALAPMCPHTYSTTAPALQHKPRREKAVHSRPAAPPSESLGRCCRCAGVPHAPRTAPPLLLQA